MMLNDLTLQPLKQNWASRVKDLLNRLGFLEVWEPQGVGNIQTFLNIFNSGRETFSLKSGTLDYKIHQDQDAI